MVGIKAKWLEKIINAKKPSHAMAYSRKRLTILNFTTPNLPTAKTEGFTTLFANPHYQRWDRSLPHPILCGGDII
jgi:hypothetical protein